MMDLDRAPIRWLVHLLPPLRHRQERQRAAALKAVTYPEVDGGKDIRVVMPSTARFFEEFEFQIKQQIAAVDRDSLSNDFAPGRLSFFVDRLHAIAMQAMIDTLTNASYIDRKRRTR